MSDFGSGSLLRLFQNQQFKNAAAPFVRVLVRVPDAYVLLRPLGAVRPGLVVLDADGRTVSSVSLAKPFDTDFVIKSIAESSKKKGREFFALKVSNEHRVEFIRLLGDTEGVDRPQIRDGRIELWANAGALTIPSIESLGVKVNASIEFVDPIEAPVSMAKAPNDDACLRKAIATLPGVRYTRRTKVGRSMWISLAVLHTSTLQAAGLNTWFARTRYTFKNLPLGGGAVVHFKRAAAQQGVVSVVPEVAKGTIDLIVNRIDFDKQKALKALLKGGLTLKE